MSVQLEVNNNNNNNKSKEGEACGLQWGIVVLVKIGHVAISNAFDKVIHSAVFTGLQYMSSFLGAGPGINIPNQVSFL